MGRLVGVVAAVVVEVAAPHLWDALLAVGASELVREESKVRFSRSSHFELAQEFSA